MFLPSPILQHALSLPKGGQFVFRVEIGPEEKCDCKRTIEQHRGYCFHEIKTNKDAEAVYNWMMGHTFFPRRFSIGKTFCVQASPRGGALCGFNGCATNGEVCGKDVYAPEHFGNEHPFLPVRFKIESGAWHRDWAKTATEEDWAKEVILEGFRDRRIWKKWYPDHGINIDGTWRVLSIRVQ